jgi:hypothetical protein
MVIIFAGETMKHIVLDDMESLAVKSALLMVVDVLKKRGFKDTAHKLLETSKKFGDSKISEAGEVW